MLLRSGLGQTATPQDQAPSAIFRAGFVRRAYGQMKKVLAQPNLRQINLSNRVQSREGDGARRRRIDQGRSGGIARRTRCRTGVSIAGGNSAFHYGAARFTKAASPHPLIGNRGNCRRQETAPNYGHRGLVTDCCQPYSKAI